MGALRSLLLAKSPKKRYNLCIYALRSASERYKGALISYEVLTCKISQPGSGPGHAAGCDRLHYQHPRHGGVHWRGGDSGIYLLAQYNAYQTVSDLADLATGETADDVKAVLKAQCTGTIGDEKVTTDGADYLQRLTLRSLQYYAAVESKFAELGATLEDAATSEAADTAASMWESDGDVYKANGISQATLEQYQLNSAKADACLELIYGENGQTPVTDQDYLDFLNNECRYVDVVQLPLFDSASYAFADEDQSAQIQTLAEECAATLNNWATVPHRALHLHV